jgi:ribosomal protein S18 acetylase RimI-like enzyme
MAAAETPAPPLPPLPQGARVRKLRASDREAVADIIRDVYGGHDYVLRVFEQWLSDARCHAYGEGLSFSLPPHPTPSPSHLSPRAGIEMDDADGTPRLVALENLSLVDDGRTAFFEALRTHRDFRRRGLARALWARMQRIAETELRVERARFTTSNLQEASLRLGADLGYAAIHSRGFGFLSAEQFGEALRRCDALLRGAGGEAEAEHDLVDVASVDALLSLVPLPKLHALCAGHVVLDWKVTELSEAALRKLVAEGGARFLVNRGTRSSCSLARESQDLAGRAFHFSVFAATLRETLLLTRRHLREAARAGAKSAMYFFAVDLEHEMVALQRADDRLTPRTMLLLEKRLAAPAPPRDERAQ